MRKTFFLAMLIFFFGVLPTTAGAAKQIEGTVPPQHPLQPPPPGFYERPDVTTDNSPPSAPDAIAPDAPADLVPGLVSPSSGTATPAAAPSDAAAAVAASNSRRLPWILGLLIIAGAGTWLWLRSAGPKSKDF